MANSWWEIKILCDPVLEDLALWRLLRFGCRGAASESKGQSLLVQAYIPQMRVKLLDLSALAVWLRQDAIALDLPKPKLQWNLIDEEDWGSTWKQHWHPQPVGDRFIVYPAWLTPTSSPERIAIRLDPGVAFGTGTHPTTQLCIEALEMRVKKQAGEAIIADIGCGSGILSLCSIFLGAKRVYAVDTDSLAVSATRSNRDLNQIPPQRLVVEQGSVEQLAAMSAVPFDGIICNILAETIVQLVPLFGEIAKLGSWGVLSGIQLEQAQPVKEALEANGWAIGTLWRRKDWCCLNIRRPDPDL